MTTTNEARITEMERTLRTAPEPGDVSYDAMGEEISMTKTSVKSAGYVTMWNTDSKEASVFNMNGVRAKLREVFPNDYEENPSMRGKPCWTAQAPAEKPWRGTSTCPLHDSRPEREAYNLVGYPRCSRVELPNEMDAQEHLRLKHPRTWTLMNVQRVEVDRIAAEEDRVLNRKILEHLAGVSEVVQPVVANVGTPVESVVQSFVPEVSRHIHMYAHKMGSPCKTAGCSEVRTTEFKARKKK
jgi:hypothetical protein